MAATDVTADFCRLSWKPPQDDGGSRVTNYVIEKQADGRSAWTKVSTYVRSTTYDVVNLDEGSVLKFRVSAENQHGVGPPLEGSQAITIKDPFGINIIILKFKSIPIYIFINLSFEVSFLSGKHNLFIHII